MKTILCASDFSGAAEIAAEYAASMDLLAFLPHHHSLLEKLIYPSETKDMIFRTEIPLLIFPVND